LVDGKYWPPFFSATPETHGYSGDNTASGGPREWLWIYLDEYQETVNPDYDGNAIDDPMPIMWWILAARRAEVAWLDEDEFLILANHVNSPNDVFEFTTAIPGGADGTVIANTVENVHPVPNPYYNTHELEVDQFNRYIKFINLPPTEVTIRIFNLAGDLVKTIERTDPTQAEVRWENILNEAGIPIASGLYIYHIDAQGLGSKVGKMAIFTEVEQLDNF
jgi:hypothetical protein